MDKFTVDLDQVLNDFEYSELTDQYNTSKVLPEHSSTQGVTKHSINNVFHSLNEYLNTNVHSIENIDRVDKNLDDFKESLLEISDNTKSIEGPKTEQRFNNFGEFSQHSFVEPLISEENENNTNSSFAENIEKHTEDSFQIDEKVSTAPGQVSVAEDNLVSKEIENVVESILVDTGSYENPKEIEKLSEEAVKDDKVIAEDFGVSIEDVDKQEQENQHISLQAELLQADNNSRDEIGYHIKQEVGDNVVRQETKTLVGFQEDLNLDDHEINKLLSELEEDDDLNFEDEESQIHTDVSENEGCEVNETCSVDNTESKELQTAVVRNIEIGSNVETESNVETGSSVEIETIVETKRNIEAIDQENQLEESRVLSLISSEQLGISDSITDQSNIEEKVTDNKASGDVSDNNNLASTVSHLERENICSSQENISKEVHIQELQANNTVDELPKEIVSLSSNKEDNGSTINTSVEDVSLVNKENNTLRNGNDSSKVENNSEEIAHREGSQESLQRPQDLPLSSELIETNRTIDLIGGPGSTPYNNIYINNELDKEDNSDMECSSSSSGSFSDASSTASTASTEDIQDKNDTTNAPKPVENPTESTSAQQDTFNPDTDVNAVALTNSFDNPEESLNNIDEDRVAFPSDSAQDSSTNERTWLGKEAPLWIPDSEAMSCLHCDMRFTMLKRRHHCRACGLVLCSKCCYLRFRLEYLDAEARVCNKCHDILNKESSSASSSGSVSPDSAANSPDRRRPNPNNPAEYCSTISPLQQAQAAPPPAVMVPVGVLKRKGSNKAKSNKSVMFCDGIRPGSDLTNLDNDFNYNNTVTKKLEKNNISAGKMHRNLPIIDSETNTFIPKNENALPPTVATNKMDVKYTECSNNSNIVNTLKNEQLTFAIHISLHVNVKIIDMNCCMNKIVWCFSTEGLINVGQDEIVYLLEYIDDESLVPKDVFYHISNIYTEAVKGNAIKELGISLHNTSNFLDSKNHAGFVYIRPTFQCLENVLKPKDPYLIGILIHRWETPWAKLFPLRLVLRLGAEYRYYPSPIISTRHRDSVYVEIGHTIINILADFRNFSYTLPQIRGLTIHMEDKNTTVSIPVNRYDQVIKSLNNSSDHILAFAGNFSLQADSHLVCIQDTQGNENCYSTHAINIHNKPRKITGASFIVFNGALKSSSGLTAKSNIIEDGLMVQVLPEHLEQIRESLRAMKNHTIQCGCVDNVSDETVQITWSENDTNFNMGIVSTIDSMSLSGIPSIRVHNGKNYMCHSGGRIIRWTEVFIIQNGEDNPRNQDPIDISRVSENIAKATCDALVKYIDLLIANNFQKIGIRTTLHVDNVSYCAGSNGTKLPPIYMKSLDNELIPVLHRITSNNLGENAIILELIFRILNV